MPVIYKLACLTARGRKTRTVNDVIETAFEHEKQVFARDTLLATSFLKVVAKLLFEDEVNTFYLLLCIAD